MPALSSAGISHYRYLSPCSKHLTFQTRRITANAVIVTNKNHTATLHSGSSLSFAVYGASAILECKDTKKNVLKQDFSEKIWKYQKKYLSLHTNESCI